MSIEAPSTNAEIEMNKFGRLELRRVVDDAARHAQQTEPVHRQERRVEGEEHQPEVPLAESSRRACARSSSATSSTCRRRCRTRCRRRARSAGARRRSTCRARASRPAPTPSITPVTPPKVNVDRKPIAKSIGVSSRIGPPHSVATHEKILMPVGMAIEHREDHERQLQPRRQSAGEHVVRPHHERRPSRSPPTKTRSSCSRRSACARRSARSRR